MFYGKTYEQPWKIYSRAENGCVLVRFSWSKKEVCCTFFLEQFHARKLIAATVCADISFCSSRFFFSSSDRRPDLSV